MTNLDSRTLIGRITGVVGFQGAMLILIGLGILLRTLSVLFSIPRADGAFYATLGYNLVNQGDYISLNGAKTYNFSLTFPAYLAAFYAVFGFSIIVTQLASFLLSLLVVVLSYFATRNLFDQRKALIVAAVLSMTSALIVVTGKNYIENIVLLFFIPTVWALIKGFEDSRYLPLGAFFAGMSYYTKTDVGLYIALGGMLAFAVWRFLYLRLQMFKDKYYWLAFAVIVLMVAGRFLLVSLGNVPSQSLTRTISISFNITVFLFQCLLHMFLVLGFFIFWYPETRRALSRYREENTSFVLLLIGALTLLAILSATAWGLLSAKVLIGVSREYITIIYIPAMWMFFRYAKQNLNQERRGFLTSLREFLRSRRRLLAFVASLALATVMIFFDDWLAVMIFFGAFCFPFQEPSRRLAILFVALTVLSANAVTAVYRPAYVDAAEEINETLQSGEVIALARENGSSYLTLDRVFPYFSRRDISLQIYEGGSGSDYIISETAESYPSYKLVGTFEGESRPSALSLAKDRILGKGGRQHYPEKTVYLWIRS
ncbi:MAG: ArnT family glycosyltransferase [Thermoplasmata archaeon]